MRRLPALAAAAACAWLAGVAASGPVACGAGAPRPTGVVLVVFDTLRADRLSAYGNPRETSPVFDALAERGVLFEQAVSVAPWTLPSMIGLLSARFPSARVYEGERLTVSAVEALRAAGVDTAAFTEGGFASARFGFDRGFDVYEEREGAVALGDPGTGADGPGGGARPRGGIGATFEAAAAWLEARPADAGPFFLLVHTYEPHTPYQRLFFTAGLGSGRLESASLELSEQMRIRRGEIALGPEELAYLAALYDGGVRVADGWLGKLLEALRRRGIDGQTALIVTSDHGEDLGERDPALAAEHGHSLFDELLRVPLLVHDPTRRYPRARSPVQVRTLDVMPTVFDLLGLAPPEGAHGTSLLPVMRGDETAPRVAFARLTRKGKPRAAVRDGRFKWIRELGPSAEREDLYDLRADPGERAPLGAPPPEALDARRALDRFLETLDDEGALDFALPVDDLPAGLREQLRALGYLEPEAE